MSFEKRSDRRKRVDSPARYYKAGTADKVRRGTTVLNFSRRGLMFLVKEPIPVDSEIVLEFLPSGAADFITVHVRTRRLMKLYDGRNYLVGCEFTECPGGMSTVLPREYVTATAAKVAGAFAQPG